MRSYRLWFLPNSTVIGFMGVRLPPSAPIFINLHKYFYIYSRSRIMNYKKIYESIINFRKENLPSGYKELHHIKPKSLGGDDCLENLVYLTAREHFICHFLLTKMFLKESFEWYKMNHAFMMMKASSYTHNRYFNSRLYKSCKTNFSQTMKKNTRGKNNSQYGSKWIHHTELKISKKIPKSNPIPEGWKTGRVVNWNSRISICPCCNKSFSVKTKEKYCSIVCKSSFAKKSKLEGREQEFLNLYSTLGSANKALKQMGYKGAVGYFYEWSKSLLNKDIS